jgi:diketogulonate reductase-like aldo/keto reductase
LPRQIRAIGVSNFESADMNQLIKSAKNGPPQVLQNWMDPFYQSRAMRRLCEEHGVFFQVR